MREFLYVDDMAAASVYVMNLDKRIYDQQTEPMLSHINVGFGSDVTIKALAQSISEVVGFQGSIGFDVTKPDGTARKLMDSGRLNSLGWHAQVHLKDGLTKAYQDYLTNNEALRK
jgi:GDP-L-fucose synthase